MKILVDADACPVIGIVERLAKKHNIPVILFSDIHHALYSDYSEIIVVGAGMDAVDFALVQHCREGDIVVTQDYGVAAMVLGKKAVGIHQGGKWYTNETIDYMLMERHMAKEARRNGKKHSGKGPQKRTREDDLRFEDSMEKLILRQVELLGKRE